MRCASALSTATDSKTAFEEVLTAVQTTLGGESADFALVLGSFSHGSALGQISKELRRSGLVRHVLGCTGESIIGPDREIENHAALSLWVAKFPDTHIAPFALDYDPPEFEGWPQDGGSRKPENRWSIVLGDPFTFPVDEWFARLERDRKGLNVIGGMASAGQGPGQNVLVVDDQVRRGGAVGVLLDGPLKIRSVVSQGCRPVGRPMIVTRVEENIIREFGRRPALEVLRELVESLDEEDRKRTRQGLHIGRVINEYKEKFGRGDFLVRNVLGLDPSGGIAITDFVRVGQTVQFHVRDAQTADEDLRAMLNHDKATQAPPAGALVFSCNGRGRRLFKIPDHDITSLQNVLGPIPAAGFFAMGELGPVGGQNFVHGFTASIALFG